MLYLYHNNKKILMLKMCNHCECENEEKCSIIGNLPIGFCCQKCLQYEEHNKCSHYQLETLYQSIKFFP